jgi:hypothetical protein
VFGAVGGKIKVASGKKVKVNKEVVGAGSGKFVDGLLVYTFSSTGSKRFETGEGNDYLPLTVNFTSLTGSGDVEVIVLDRTVTPPGGPIGSNKVLKRYFRVNQTGLSSFNANLTLTYTDGDVSEQGISDETSLRVFQWDGSQWRELTITDRNTTNNTITVTGVNSFSDFIISGTGDAPLPVRIRSFTASLVSNVVRLEIETGSEDEEFLGFNVYRGEREDEFNLIASYREREELRSKRSGAFGSRYEFEDRNVREGMRYYYRIGIAYMGGERVYDKVVDVLVEVPREFVLYQNYPNPFNPITTIKFDLPEDRHVNLLIYDVRGGLVSKLIDRDLKAGRYEVVLDFGEMPSGVYFYVLKAGDFVDVKKMVLVK